MNTRLFFAIMAAMVMGCLQAWGPPVDPDDPDWDGDWGLGWGEYRAGIISLNYLIHYTASISQWQW